MRMIYTIVFLLLQIIALIIFVPIKINVKYHFSLNRGQSVVIVRLYFFQIAHVVIGIDDKKLHITINGKEINLDKNQSNKLTDSNIMQSMAKNTIKDAKRKSKNKKKVTFPIEKLPSIVTYLKMEKIIGASYLLAYVGGEDAMSSALQIGIINILFSTILKNVVAYPDFETNRCDFDMRVRAKLNLYQLIELLALSKKTKKIV